MVERRTLFFAVISIVIWAVLASGLAGYYYAQYGFYRERYQYASSELAGTIRINALIESSANDPEWHNGTRVQINSTAFTALATLANVTYTGNEGSGVLINSINELHGNSTMFWFFWNFDAATSKWNFQTTYSVDKYALMDNETIAFCYESTMNWPPPEPA